MKTKLDERQLMNRYKIGLQSFILTLFLLLTDILIQDVFSFTWASHFAGTMFLIYIMLTFFAIRCIFADSYFAEGQRRSVRNLMLLSLLGGVIVGVTIIAAMISGRFLLIENNMLSDKSITVAWSICMIAVPLCYFLKKHHDRKEES